MIEFKQIIGRGTRLFDGKDYFTIYDFVKAYEHFSDPEWDGEPIEPVPPPLRRREERRARRRGDGRKPRGGSAASREDRIKLADGKERTIQHMMATTFWSVDGRPMSAAEFISGCSAISRRSSRTRTSCGRCGASPTRAKRCWIASPRRAMATSSSARSDA